MQDAQKNIVDKAGSLRKEFETRIGQVSSLIKQSPVMPEDERASLQIIVNRWQANVKFVGAENEKVFSETVEAMKSYQQKHEKLIPTEEQ